MQRPAGKDAHPDAPAVQGDRHRGLWAWGRGGGIFVARFAYRLGSKHWCLDMAMGTEEGGLLACAGAIAFKQVASWEVQGEGFFSEAWQAMRGHVATFRAALWGRTPST